MKAKFLSEIAVNMYQIIWRLPETPPATAEVKKIWIYASTHPILFHGIVLN
jgi:hypothetical protein